MKITRMIKRIIKWARSDESGQALIAVLMLLGLGSLLIAPILSLTGSDLQAGQVYEAKADELYAADAGVEDALWNIRNDQLEDKFGAYPAYNGYDPYYFYDYDGYGWPYTLEEQINGKTVNVEIKNMWIPLGIQVPDPELARKIIQGEDEENPPKLIVTGNAPAGTTDYEIKITFLPGDGEQSSLMIETIGVWLPPTFTYDVSCYCNLLDSDIIAEEYQPAQSITSHASGTAIVWDFNGVSFTEAFGVAPDNIQIFSAIFEYIPDTEGVLPEGVAWVDTSGVDGVTYTWDADVKIFRINSVATTDETGSDTEIEAHAIKSEMRQLVGAISGDYYATGDAFLYPSSNSGEDYKFRDDMYSSGSAEVYSVTVFPPDYDYDPVNGVPDNAAVIGAYLYWTGWIDNDGYSASGDGAVVWRDDCDEYGTSTPVWDDGCDEYGSAESIWTEGCDSLGSMATLWDEDGNDFDDGPYSWSDGSRWSDHYYYSGSYTFRCYSGGSQSSKTLTLSEGIDLSAYAGETVTLSWNQYTNYSVDNSDTLYFAGYNGSWSGWQEAFHGRYPSSTFSMEIPQDYLTGDFRLRFWWDADNGSGNEYVYIDNIQISVEVGSVWDAGSHWSDGGGEFSCYGGGTADDRTLTYLQDIDLSAYAGSQVSLSIDVSDSGAESGDTLTCRFYDGSSWSGSQTIFEGDQSGGIHSVVIPEEYVTASFRVLFTWNTTNSGEYCYIESMEVSSFSGAWEPGVSWDIYNNDEFRCIGNGDTEDCTLTRVEDIDLSGYTGQTVTISWEQSEYGYLSSDDQLIFYLSNDGGNTWGISGVAFSDDDPSSPYEHTIPQEYLTAQFRIRFVWTGNHTYGDEYCYIDDLTISTFAGDWAPGSHWYIDSHYGNSSFACYGGDGDADRTLTRVTPIDLSPYTGQAVKLSAYISDDYASTGDRLYCQFYDGSGWSSLELLYEGNWSSGEYFVEIPEEYLTDQFLVKFLWDEGSSYEEVYIDYIEIIASSGSYNGLEYPDNPTEQQIIDLVENNARVSTIKFGLDGWDYDDDMVYVNADTYEVLEPYINDGYGHNAGEGTWSYCCYADVTELITEWTTNEYVEINGAGIYTVANAWVGVQNEVDPSYWWSFEDGDGTGYPLGTPADTHDLKDQNCHSGWSLILIYSSPATKGHQLYLYDINNPKFEYTQARNEDPDFDGDGLPGGIVRGFLVPEQIPTESEAGRITVFVGEGDRGRAGDNWGDDYIEVNNHKLWDGINCFNNSVTSPNNAWNSGSVGLTLDESGIDIDTFSISWVSGILQEGDVEAHVNLPTDSDGIHILYIILSFRSDIFTGGTMTFLIN